MLSFKDFLVFEHYINLLPGDEDLKRKYAPAVKSILDKSYASIGGIHGSGFKDHEDMVHNIPMWKIKTRPGNPGEEPKIIAVGMYKDSKGRKYVAGGTDGTSDGKKSFMDMSKTEVHRSYMEISKAPLALASKNLGEKIHNHVIPFHEVSNYIKDEIRPVPHDDPEALKYPHLAKHMYQRQIGDQWHTKIMIGTPNKPIVPMK